MKPIRPIGFFVHHQGRGHARRCEAILAEMGDRPVTIMSASREIFGDFDDRVDFRLLPNAIGAPSRTHAMHDQQTPRTMHCVPLGSAMLRENAHIIGSFFGDENPGLFVSDVSVEWTLLARLYSVPAVKLRMHGQRNDPGHYGAYEACAGLLAPFDEALEQDDYPDWAHRKTFYSGGLCTTTDEVRSKQDARRALGLPSSKEIILVLSGGGGSGSPYAPLTVGARAMPDALWLTAGKLHLEGHETDFANLANLGWTDRITDYIAAADIVIASAGDNTVTEICRVGRPLECVPEWRYFDEQTCKARELHRLGAAHTETLWPADYDTWTTALSAAAAIDLDRQKSLFTPDAAQRIAQYLEALEDRLWTSSTEADGGGLQARPTLVA